MKLKICSSLLLLANLASAQGVELEWSQDPVPQFQAALKESAPSPKPTSAESGPIQAEDAAKFADLIKSVQSGEAIDKADIQWARSLIRQDLRNLRAYEAAANQALSILSRQAEDEEEREAIRDGRKFLALQVTTTRNLLNQLDRQLKSARTK